MRWVSFLALFAMAGCASTLAEVRSRVKEGFRTEALPRAAFELSCPAESLEVVDLTPDRQFAHGSQMGVSGCGKKVVYVYLDNVWVNNTGGAKNQEPTQR